jgi:prefoldin subunit 5
MAPEGPKAGAIAVVPSLPRKTAHPDVDGLVAPRDGSDSGPHDESGSIVMSHAEVQRLERQVESIRTEIARINDRQDHFEKTHVAVAKTCERILDRVESLDSQIHLSQKQIHSVDEDFRSLKKMLDDNADGLRKTILKAGGGGAAVLILDALINFLLR